MVLVSPDSERTMHTYLGITAELSAQQIDFTALETAQWLYIEGYLSTSDTARVAVQQARAIAKANGVKIALTLSDPAMVQYARQGLDELLDDGVDLLFCNEQEALMYTHTDNLEAALAALRLKSHMVVITLSEKGALIATQDEQFNVAGRQVLAVDANGAGDAFIAAMVMTSLQTKDIREWAKNGSAAAISAILSEDTINRDLSLEKINEIKKEYQIEWKNM